MDSVPLLPKAKVLPNLDASPLLRELFQNEFQAVVPSKKITENILRGLQCKDVSDDEETLKADECLDCLANRKENVIEFTENVIEAYKTHEKNLNDIREAEKNIFETHADFLKREVKAFEDEANTNFLTLKRQPLFKALDPKYVKKYKLLQGEAGLPLQHELNTDFRVKNFLKLRKELEKESNESLLTKYLKKSAGMRKTCRSQFGVKKNYLLQEIKLKKGKKPMSKNKKGKKAGKEFLKAEPKALFFTNYKVGDVYVVGGLF